MIYFIADGAREAVGQIKIGYTDNNVEQRLCSLQVGNSKKLILLWTIDGDISLEKAIHNALSNCRIRGEWFKYNNETQKLLSNFFQERILSGDVNILQARELLEEKARIYLEECCVMGI